MMIAIILILWGLCTIEQKYWSIDEVSERLGISKPTLYRWSSEGLGPRPLRIGRRLRYGESELERWLQELDEQQREPAS
jgi:excisionase family DNA binding protein